MSDDFASLPGTLDAVWHRLNAGVADATHPARLPVLATAGLRGGASVRVLVLRSADRDGARLTFHTHARSGKVAEIAEDPLAQVLVWDPDASFQMRLGVEIEILTGPAGLWQRLGEGSRLNYTREPLPGQTLSAPDAGPGTPDPDMFAELQSRIGSIETLHIADGHHRRAIFAADGAFAGQWIAP